MKKIFTLALGGLLAIGAAAVAIPAALDTAAAKATQARVDLDDPDLVWTPVSVDGSSIKIAWDPTKSGLNVTFTAPTKASCTVYDPSYQRLERDMEAFDKVEIRRAIGWGSDDVIATLTDVNPGDTYTYFDGNVEVGTSYAYKIVPFYKGKTPGYSYQSSSVKAGSFPEKIDDKKIYVTSDKGKAPYEIHFTAPKFIEGSEVPITSLIDEIRIYTERYDYSIYDYVVTEYGKLNDVVPGTEQVVVIADELAPSTYYLQFACTAMDGPGSTASYSFYAGNDTPAMPKNVILSEGDDGKVKMTWDAVTTGQNNGYIDPEEITYTIIEYDGWNEKEVATKIAGTEYVFEDLILTCPTELRFGVKSVWGSNSSSTTESNRIVAGPACELPFNDTFNSVKDYSCVSDQLWSKATGGVDYNTEWSYGEYCYINNDKVYPADGEGGLASASYSTYYDAAAWSSLISPKINVEGIAELKVSFDLLTIANKNSALEVLVSFDGGENQSVLATNVGEEVPEGKAYGWVKKTATVTVPDDAKELVVTFTATCNDQPTIVSIDNVKVADAEAEAEIYPSSATDFTAAYDFENEVVNVKFTTPSKTHANLGDVRDEALPFLTAVKLFRHIGDYTEWTEVKTWDNPAVGTELTFEDTDLAEGGKYFYKVVCYVNKFCDYGAFLEKHVMVGQIPAEVDDITCTTIKGEAPVTITFTLPTKDNEGADLREIKSAKLDRYDETDYSWSTVTIFTENLIPGQEITFSDNDVVAQTKYRYRVIVVGSAGTSDGSNYGNILVGKDKPEIPKNIKFEKNEDDSYTISWDAVTQGYNGGYIDIEKVTYTVMVGSSNSDYSAEVMAEGITETSYTFTCDEEASIKYYFVKGVADGFEGYTNSTGSVVVGGAASLPYSEHFNKKAGSWSVVPEHAWTATRDDAGSSNFTPDTYTYYGPSYEDVYPSKMDGGLLLISFGTWSSTEFDAWYTSGEIKLADASTIVAKFDWFKYSGYNMTAAFEVSYDGGEFQTAWDVDFAQIAAGDDKWETAIVPLNAPAGAKKMVVRFKAHKGTYSNPVIFDDLDIFDVPAPTLALTEKDLSWEVADCEHLDLHGFHLYRDGNRHLDTHIAADVNKHEGLSDDGFYTLTALYNEGNIETAHSNGVDYKDNSGVGSAVADGILSIKAEGHAIVVAGAEGLQVVVATVDGKTIYSAEGDATIAVVPGIYLVKVADAPAVKLAVK